MQLGTNKQAEEVYNLLGSLGFDFRIDSHCIERFNRVPKHKETGLNLTVQPATCFHRGVEGINTEIEVCADGNPDYLDDSVKYICSLNPKYIRVIKDMYDKMPDLIYLKDYNTWFSASYEDKPKVERPALSDYFEELNKRDISF